MVRYMNKKGRDGDIPFREGENMMMNMVRVLAHPRSEANVYFLPVIDATGQPRRALADAARTAVISSYEDQI